MPPKIETPQTQHNQNRESDCRLENSLENEKIKAILSFDIIRTRNPSNREIVYRCVEINGVHSDFPDDMMDLNKTTEGNAITDHIKHRSNESNQSAYKEKIIKACRELLDLSYPSDSLITQREKSFFSYFFTSLKIHMEHPDFEMDLNMTVLNDHIFPILAREKLHEYKLEFMKLLGKVLLLTENEWSSSCDLNIQLITEDKALQVDYVDVRCFTGNDLEAPDWDLRLYSNTGTWILKKRDGCSGEWNHTVSNREFVAKINKDSNPKDFLRNILDTYVVQEFHNKIPDNTISNSDTGDLRIHIEVEIDPIGTVTYKKCLVLAVTGESGMQSINGSLRELLINQVTDKIRRISMDTRTIY